MDAQVFGEVSLGSSASGPSLRTTSDIGRNPCFLAVLIPRMDISPGCRCVRGWRLQIFPCLLILSPGFVPWFPVSLQEVEHVHMIGHPPSRCHYWGGLCVFVSLRAFFVAKVPPTTLPKPPQNRSCIIPQRATSRLTAPGDGQTFWGEPSVN